ncbi:hypothetical protein [Caulobacter sp. RHG1]|uniref:hypothetical protein n=1 Tax=Caulobacter sp. (strain RHG1) TaxID=2545762 RepID=UPI001552264E|nr:hypothetical protein [Caulobacter sp. RHG1]NQE65306.1 hypothetical protein [Caulobacter sp. RHG1]
MRITNPLSPIEIFTELLRRNAVTDSETVQFKNFKHDKDLCPSFTEILEGVLGVFGSYHTDVHDIQGFSDEGIDVLLRYRADDGEHKIGLQIKSYDEFELWAKEKLDVLKTLKAQYATAMHTVRTEEYFVVLCTDAAKHRGRIRSITSALKTFANCTIVKPKEALGLLQLGGLDTFIQATRLICQDDRTLQAAESYVADMPPAQAYAVIALVCGAFENGPDLDERDIVEFLREWEETFHAPRLDAHEEVDIIDDLVTEQMIGYADGVYRIDVRRLPEQICALYFDQKVLGTRTDRSFRIRLAKLLDLAP